MITITNVFDTTSLNFHIKQEDFSLFLHEHLDRFTDDVSAISKAIDYAFSTEEGKGGFVLLAYDEKELVGGLVMNCTGMEEFVPENLLVYIAVHKSYRGKGIGSRLIQQAIETSEGSIALHVEYDNPAVRLYERLGFKSKYREMRWERGS